MGVLKKKKIIFVGLLFFCLFSFSRVEAANTELNFNIDSNYDVSGRSVITATLVKTDPKLYFYVEKSWWGLQVPAKQNEILNNIDTLSQEFNGKIYPTLTSFFGSEWKPGVDNDERITVLFHSIRDGAGGYFRTADEYVKIQSPDSNEREMLYLPISEFDNQYRLKVSLAHEFVHLITFNQKERPFDVQEEIWLNEARAEYATTIMSYNTPYGGSYLQNRVKNFLEIPSDSLTEWQDNKYDYAVVDVFTQYIVDHYGINILIDSLKSKYVGIESINKALQKNGFDVDFSNIFTDWTIAVLVNNCSVGEKYCFLTENLNNIHLIPSLNFLPLSGTSSLSVANITKNWVGNWQKIFGGSGSLKVTFSSLAGLNFKVPYVVQDKDGSIIVKFLSINKEQVGEFTIPEFGAKQISVIIIPSLQTKTAGFDGGEPTYPFTFTASIFGQQTIPNGNPLIPAGFNFQKNLTFGVKNQDVIYLKLLLASEECVSGLANTNYFAAKTLAAVKCFQNKYKAEISAVAGYAIKATGFVGMGTRNQLNILLKKIAF